MENLPVFTKLILLLSCLLASDSVCSKAHVVNCLASDRDALADFKTGLQHPQNLLSSWRGANCCQWYGIQCDNTTGAVVAIDLHNPYPYQSQYYSPNRYELWSLSGEIRPSLVKLKSLRHLDLSFNKFKGIPIPKFIGSIENLQYLNLSSAGFSGTIPPNLGNLSHLEVLDLEEHIWRLDVENLQWVTGFVSLKYLSMGGVNLSLVKDWAGPLNQLPFIVELRLSSCDISGHILPTSLNFTSLVVIDLSYNNFRSMIPYWLVNISSLQYIDMRYSGLHGKIPVGFGELPNLVLLDLSQNGNLTATCPQLFKGRWEKIQELHLNDNRLHGELPSSLGNMTSLMYLDLSFNDISGGIPSSFGKLYNLTYFSLSGNNMSGSLPEFLEGTESHPSRNPLPNLLLLDLSYNNLVGKITIWLGQLENMVELILNNNKLIGIVSEAHFSKLTKLKLLHLPFNQFTMNVSSNWIPPFQVQHLSMGSCILGPSFPSWLKSQKEVRYLDFSNAGISGYIPSWFWNISSNLFFMNISHNELQGKLLNPLSVADMAIIDLSFNLLEGPIPLAMARINFLDLSHNYFFGPVPENLIENVVIELNFLSLSSNQLSGEIPMSIGLMSYLRIIDLSSNNFIGRIPSSLANCSNLIAIDLGNNNLSGAIPDSLGQLRLLETLHLSNNHLSGNLPSSLFNLSYLQTMNLENNEFSGEIPSWNGDGNFSLRILNLRSNAFSGEIPFDLSKLSSLQVLDLGDNDLSGSIPASLGDLKAMAEEQKLTRYLLFGEDGYEHYEESLVMETKGQLLRYTKTLFLVTSIDLSGNNLSGRFPQEITKLSGLVNLNLSRNHITGNIPSSISNLHQLLSLDLSSNKFNGTIPSSLSSLSFLGYLNLSNNNLTGAIPYIGQTTTFDAPSFVGNPGLCGPPLPLSSRCLGDEDHGHVFDKGASIEEKYDDGGFIDNWFYLSLGLGFAVGILVPYIVLAKKRSWSDAYFDFLDTVVYELFVLIHRRINHGHWNKPRPRQ